MLELLSLLPSAVVLGLLVDGHCLGMCGGPLEDALYA
jgi:sulfite exporter TauE/SafE